MSRTILRIALATAAIGLCTSAQAQWVKLVSDPTRMPTGPGQNVPGVTTADPEEKDYAWGDVDRDGDTDLVVVRKVPFTNPGGKRGVLFMNEGGVLIDRASTLANTAINVPGTQGVSQGMLDLTNDRDVVLADVNNDGWLDIVTATTISDTQPPYIALPRVYMNQGSIGGVWQGFVYDFGRIPQMLSKTGVVAMPRFCSVTASDVTGDGYVDLYWGDYDSSGAGGSAESPANDYDNKLLINMGAANPGFFVDESVARMGSMFSYPAGVGSKNLLYSTFGAASVFTDINGDGIKDLVKQTSLVAPQHIATVINNPANVGFFTSAGYKIQNALAPYFVSTGDLNNDGKIDFVSSDDNADRFQLNTGNDANGNPSFGSSVFTFGAGGDDGFGSQSVITDLNNDGWNDVLISDVDVDIGPCGGRRLHIYHNLGGSPLVIKEESPSVIATGSLTGTYNVAAFDLDNDGWKDLVIGRCNTTTVWMQTPPASLAFSYPAGHPTSLTPGQASVFQVQLTGTNGGTPVDGTGKINISVNGGATFSTNMTSLGGGLYEATIPAVSCASNVRYSFSGQYTAAGVTGSPTVTDPADVTQKFSAYAASGTQSALTADFEAGSAGWTVANDGSLTGGGWEVADPVGTWNEGVRAAPEDDYSPVGSNCFVTQNGSVGGALSDADVDGGSTSLDSPTLDLAGNNATVTFAYWFYSSTLGDVLAVSVSNDNGANWTPVTSLKGPYLGQANTYVADPTTWKTFSFVVGDFVVPSNQVKVRFGVNDVAPAGIVEAAIDDVQIDSFVCSAPCPADTNGSGAVNIDDLLAVINAWGPCKGCPSDVNGNGVVNIDDLLAVINAWGKCP